MSGIIFGLLGGLSIFIFSLMSMSETLQKMAGKKTYKVMGALTSIPVVGVLVGSLATIITQSSTLITVMVVGFVNTGMLNLKQAISVIMGANIGTTLTTQLVAFRITDAWVFLATFGFIAYFFARHKMVKNTGFVVFTLGTLLLGMELMSGAMVPLRHDPTFQHLMLTFSDNRILAMLVGALFTAIVQSSTAATGVIVAMTMQDLIPFQAALPLVLGTNIGTTITAVLASIGGTVSARRAAMAHVLFNAFGALIFLAFLTQYENLILAISPANDIPRQVANAHTMFSVITTILFLPFINRFARLLTKIIPGKNTANAKGAAYLDWNAVGTPSVAMNLAQKEISRMAEMSGRNIKMAVDGFLEKDRKKLLAVKRQEDTVDALSKDIIAYLVRISQSGISDDMSTRHIRLLHAANDIERVNTHAGGIAGLGLAAIDDEIHFTDEAIGDIKDMHKMVQEIYGKAIEVIKTDDRSLTQKINRLETKIDAKEEEGRISHTKRLKKGLCKTDSSVIFLDMMRNFERIGNHSNNISKLSGV